MDDLVTRTDNAGAYYTVGRSTRFDKTAVKLIKGAKFEVIKSQDAISNIAKNGSSNTLNLLVRGVDEVLVRAIKERAGSYGRSADAEHREILAEALARPRKRALVELLASIPEVGTDADSQRVEYTKVPRVFD